MFITAAGLSDVGKKRKANQDSFRLEQTQNLFVVADGMGGHAGGETASKITVDTIVESVTKDRSANIGLSPQDLIIGAVHRANSAVFSTAQKDSKLTGMGTTCVTMLFDQNKLFVGHVGDSRIYMARKGQIWQITKDHSLVNEKLRAGVITREQMKTDKTRNVITRSVGFESSVLVDVYERDVSSGEIFLACSDGLSGMVDDHTIISVLDEHGSDLNQAATKLIALANQNGGDDNVTVILARVD